MESFTLSSFGSSKEVPTKRPSITTDACVLRQTKGEKWDILMITRGRPPFLGKFAFPGGFLDYNEDPMHGCLRELQEETGLEGKKCTLLTVKGKPGRDPRTHIVSIVYLIEVDPAAKPKHGDDAASAKFYPLEEML